MIEIIHHCQPAAVSQLQNAILELASSELSWYQILGQFL